MTLFASRVDDGPSVKVGLTYGPVSTYIVEHYQHLRSFHTQLGQLLDEMDASHEVYIDSFRRGEKITGEVELIERMTLTGILYYGIRMFLDSTTLTDDDRSAITFFFATASDAKSVKSALRKMYKAIVPSSLPLRACNVEEHIATRDNAPSLDQVLQASGSPGWRMAEEIADKEKFAEAPLRPQVYEGYIVLPYSEIVSDHISIKSSHSVPVDVRITKLA